MQLFFWFSIALLAFSSFVFLAMPMVFSKSSSTTQSSFFLKTKPVIFPAILAVASLGLYVTIGQPNMVIKPEMSEIDQQYTAIIKQIETHLANNPEDAEGWQVVAPTYLSLNQPEKAFDAFANAIKFGNSNGKNWLGLGKANLMVNKGVFGPMTKVAFTKAYEKSPNDIESLYFYASMLQNEDSLDEAKTAIDEFVASHDLEPQQLLPLTEILSSIKLNRESE